MDDVDLERFRSTVRNTLATRLPARQNHDVPRLYGVGESEEDRERGRSFLKLFADLGWTTPAWPTQHGGAGLSSAHTVVISQELEAFDVPDLYPFDVGLRMVASVLLRHGTDDQRHRWLQGIRVGDDVWCQLFSEPGAGSDLGSLNCRAELIDGGWVVNGHKIWSSRAAYSQWGLLLCRTATTENKHHGLTAFALPMGADGVTVEPIRQMNGDDHFAEVLLREVRIEDDCRLGEIDAGWGVAMTTLANERAGLRTAGLGVHAQQVRGLLEMRPNDPLLRAQVLDVIIDLEVTRMTAQRAAAAIVMGATPGPEGSGAKLRSTALLEHLTEVALDALGDDSLVDDNPWAPLVLTVPSLSIRGGTSEIQRNIISERVLGLPRDSRPS